MAMRQKKTAEEASEEFVEKKEEREIKGIDYSLRLSILKDIYEKQGNTLSKRLKKYNKKYLESVISGERAPSQRLRQVINRRFTYYTGHKDYTYVARANILFFDKTAKEYVSFEAKELKPGTLKAVEKNSKKDISKSLLGIYSRYNDLIGSDYKVEFVTARLRKKR